MPRRKQPKHQVLQRPRARRLGEAWRCMLNRAARPAVALQTVAQHSGAEEARETPISRMTAKAALVAAVVAVIQAAVATEEAVAAVAMAVVQAEILAAEMVGGWRRQWWCGRRRGRRRRRRWRWARWRHHCMASNVDGIGAWGLVCAKPVE